MLNIAVQTKGADIKSLLKKAARDNPKAAARALNRTANTVRSVAAKAIAADIGVKQKAVRQAIKVKRTTSSRIRAVIEGSGRRIPIIDLRARQTGKGVTYQKGRLRKTIF